MKNITSIILSAGFSSRMNQDKALLVLKNGKTFLRHILDNLEKAGINKIFVISQKKYKGKWGGARFIINTLPEKGMLYSIQLGVKNVDDNCKSVMIYPVDMPLVRVDTIKSLCKYASADSIVLPKYNGQKRGHPILIGRNFFDDIFEAPLDIGARYVVYKNKDKIYELTTDDEGIKININTPEIYKAFIIDN